MALRRAGRSMLEQMRQAQAGARGLRATGARQGGMGPPLEPSDPPDEQVDEEFDLVWHDGTKHYEPVFDDIPGVGKFEALFKFLVGMGVLASPFGIVKLVGQSEKRPIAPHRLIPRDEVDA